MMVTSLIVYCMTASSQKVDCMIGDTIGQPMLPKGSASLRTHVLDFLDWVDVDAGLRCAQGHKLEGAVDGPSGSVSPEGGGSGDVCGPASHRTRTPDDDISREMKFEPLGDEPREAPSSSEPTTKCKSHEYN